VTGDADHVLVALQGREAVTAEASPSGEGVAEAEQIVRAKARDSTIWALWYDAYYANLYRYAYVRLGRREDAEDVTSQVSTPLLTEAGRYSPGFTASSAISSPSAFGKRHAPTRLTSPWPPTTSRNRPPTGSSTRSTSRVPCDS
jgi:hypothetical protein